MEAAPPPPSLRGLSSGSGTTDPYDPADIFTQIFLLGGEPDFPSLQPIRGRAVELRKKRAHRKSRWGCTSCKRRKVKCDENVPCSNCKKRRETCSLASADAVARSDWPTTPMRSPPLQPRELSPIPNADAKVNLVHMELFHHFTNVTIHTLAFEFIWAELVSRSFHHEYLMTAMLAVAARHLSILNPTSRHHSNAALLLLSKSCSQFRANLDQAITFENRDARLATSMLLHYLCWCNAELPEPSQVEGRSAEPASLDLSRDQLFLLSEGVRQVRFLWWRLPRVDETVFGRIITTHRHDTLMSLVRGEWGKGHRALNARLIALYDDQRLRGTGDGAPPGELGSDLTQPPEESPHGRPLHSAPTALGIACPHTCPDTSIIAFLAQRTPHGSDASQTPAERELYRRLSFEVAADRLAVMLHASRIYESDRGMDPSMREDLERTFLSFPLLCYRPFFDLVAMGDSRALAVLYLVYRCARILLSGPGAWWAAGRSQVMEAALARELDKRGVLGVLRELFVDAVD